MKHALFTALALAAFGVSTAGVAAPAMGPEELWYNFSGAVVRDRPDIVLTLLKQGVSPNTKVEQGDPALVSAIRHDNADVVSILLDAPGIDLNLASDFGETAIMLAAFKGDEDLVRELVERGAEVNGPGGWSALHYAATNGHAYIVEFLLEKGAKVNALSPAGITPLFMAARLPSREVVMQLLKAGAYRDLCNDKGESPADAAAAAGDQDLSKFLAVEKCVDPKLFQESLPKAAPTRKIREIVIIPAKKDAK